MSLSTTIKIPPKGLGRPLTKVCTKYLSNLPVYMSRLNFDIYHHKSAKFFSA
jgi:hypothetical protein